MGRSPGETYSYLEQLSIKNLHPDHTSSRKSSPDLVKYYGVIGVIGQKCLSHRLPVLVPCITGATEALEVRGPPCGGMREKLWLGLTQVRRLRYWMTQRCVVHSAPHMTSEWPDAEPSAY